MFQDLIRRIISLLPADAFGVEEASGWTAFLKEAGGWGVAVVVAVVLSGVIVKLWMEYKNLQAQHSLENKAKDERIYNLLDKQNDMLKIVQDLKATITGRHQ